MTDDGRRVFFNSGDALVPEDTNGKVDAYEYDTQTGQVHLLSTGKSTRDSWFVDASQDGKNVFILTQQRLVGWDTDENYDLYDVRVNGGFPEPPAVQAKCTGDPCQGPYTNAPTAAVAGSTTFHGPGNVKAAPKKKRAALKCKHGFVKKRVKGRLKCVKKPRPKPKRVHKATLHRRVAR